MASTPNTIDPANYGTSRPGSTSDKGRHDDSVVSSDVDPSKPTHGHSTPQQTIFGEKKEQHRSEEDYMYEKQKISEGDHKFHKLGWLKLTTCLIVEAIALGSLSLPSAFATLGMVAGVILTVGLGIIAVYTSYVVGQVKLKFPHVSHYADAGRLLLGKFGYEFVGVMFALQLILLVGSHVLTGTIALLNISDNAICSVAFGVISAVILYVIAIPPTFSELAILGYIDFASIIIAIGVTIVGTGVQANRQPGGLGAVNWSAWPKEGITFADAWLAITNIAFAYSFAVCQFSFMDEMHTPKDFVKSINLLGFLEIVIYTVTGAVIYAFVGQDVKSPALLSAGTTLSKVAFGLALPVIFISGSINSTVVARYIHLRVFKNSVIRYVNTKMGWITWLTLILIITVIAWVIAEAIPFFSALLGLMSALFISGFTFYLPSWMWFALIKTGSWRSPKNIALGVLNGSIIVIGLLILGCGCYASVKDIINQYNTGDVRGSFSCAPIA